MQWILDHLHQAKRDADDWAQRTDSARTAYSQGSSFPVGLKRDGDPTERDDQARKRPRSGASSNEPSYSYNTTSRIDLQGSVDTARRDQALRYSPDPTDSLPSSAHPRNTSPSVAHRTARALPSPASMTFPLSAASSLPTIAAQSLGSPAPSYQAASTIHTASSHSATSAHIADLQHQVTLKSLALQTLQSEYASLLQKLQREKVKSQTIEKKTTAASQEVNELSGKNEDLTEQVKTLTSQLEMSEKKRESDRLETQREKDQWSRMLEMSGRLQAKVDAERQRLLGEKESLQLRISRYEKGSPLHPDQVAEREASRSSDVASKAPGSSPAVASQLKLPVSGQSHVETSETQILKREIAVLNGRIEAFRAALRQIREQTTTFQHISGALQSAANQALNADCAESHDPVQSARSPLKQCRSDNSESQDSSDSRPTAVAPTQAPSIPETIGDSRAATDMVAMP